MACWRHGSAEITPLLDEIASGGQRYKDNQRQWLPYLAIALSAAFAFGTFWLLSAGVYALAEEDVTFQLLLLKDDVQFPLFSGNFLFISVTIWATLRVALSVTAHLHFKGLDEQALTSIVFSPTILAINACLCTMVVAADAVLLAQRSEHWGLDCTTVTSCHRRLSHLRVAWGVFTASRIALVSLFPFSGKSPQTRLEQASPTLTTVIVTCNTGLSHLFFAIVAAVALLQQLSPLKPDPWCTRTPGHLLANAAALVLHGRLLAWTIQAFPPITLAYWRNRTADPYNYQLSAREENGPSVFDEPGDEQNSRQPQAFDFGALDQNYGTVVLKPDGNGHEPAENYQAVGPVHSEAEQALYEVTEPLSIADGDVRHVLTPGQADASGLIRRDVSHEETVLDDDGLVEYDSE
eukprot:TRINITY_DN11500_c0_g1_i1.p1 TRINITY_DN11500_c0_g1~~TRINITY_DN11500_c0_g1_i1.p1  ORF type:complete len:407 (+),score=65.67 TRINITY_DN11500_c0_g1_i1:1298-2518(+)